MIGLLKRSPRSRAFGGPPPAIPISSEQKALRVSMLVRNMCTHDARVLKEAKTLASHGYDVTIIAVRVPPIPAEETVDGFRIVRVLIDPLHYRFLRWHQRTLLSFASRVRRHSPTVMVTLAGGAVGTAIGLLMGDGQAAVIAASFGAATASAMSQPLLAWLRSHVPTSLLAPQSQPLAHPGRFGWRRALLLLAFALRSLRTVRRLVARFARFLAVKWHLFLWRTLFLAHKPFLLLDYTKRSAKIIRHEPADIYHAHDLNTLVPAVLAARKTGGKVVYDSHELNLEAGTSSAIIGLEKAFLRRYEKFLIHRADAAITVNESIANTLVDWYGIARPSIVMNCPPLFRGQIDPILRRLVELDDSAPLVLYQGGLGPNRGLRELVSAMRHLDDVTLVFLGEGYLRAELENLRNELDLVGQIHFLPPVPQWDLLRHTSSASVGVIPFQNAGLNNYFATPNKLFEYLMAGVPVAVSEFPELARIVKSARVGSVFDPTDPEDIARAIRTILDDPRYGDMRERARWIAQTRYSWENESKTLLRVYNRLRPGAARERAVEDVSARSV